MNVLLGVTGSCYSVLVPNIVNALLTQGNEVQVVMTSSCSTYFLRSRKGINASIHDDIDEHLGGFESRKSLVLHTKLRNWADILLIAPLTANTLAKLVNGIADNLLTSVVRAWPAYKPIVIAPAMDNYMWLHPVTREHLDKLQSWFFRFQVVPPSKEIMEYGVEGTGALAEVDSIVKAVMEWKDVVPLRVRRP